jgi:hypothetical protein
MNFDHEIMEIGLICSYLIEKNPAIMAGLYFFLGKAKYFIKVPLCF